MPYSRMPLEKSRQLNGIVDNLISSLTTLYRGCEQEFETNDYDLLHKCFSMLMNTIRQTVGDHADFQTAKTAYEKDVAAAKEKLKNDLKTARQAQKEEFDKARSTLHMELEEARKRETEQLRKARQAQAQELQRAKQRQEAELKSVREDQANALHQGKQKKLKELDEEMRLIRNAQAEELLRTKEKHEAALQEAIKRQEGQLDANKKQAAANLKGIRDAHAKELHEGKQAKLQEVAALEAKKNELAGEVERLTAQKNSQHKSVTFLDGRIKDLATKRATLDADYHKAHSWYWEESQSFEDEIIRRSKIYQDEGRFIDAQRADILKLEARARAVRKVTMNMITGNRTRVADMQQLEATLRQREAALQQRETCHGNMYFATLSAWKTRTQAFLDRRQRLRLNELRLNRARNRVGQDAEMNSNILREALKRATEAQEKHDDAEKILAESTKLKSDAVQAQRLSKEAQANSAASEQTAQKLRDEIETEQTKLIAATAAYSAAQGHEQEYRKKCEAILSAAERVEMDCQTAHMVTQRRMQRLEEQLRDAGEHRQSELRAEESRELIRKQIGDALYVCIENLEGIMPTREPTQSDDDWLKALFTTMRDAVVSSIQRRKEDYNCIHQLVRHIDALYRLMVTDAGIDSGIKLLKAPGISSLEEAFQNGDSEGKDRYLNWGLESLKIYVSLPQRLKDKTDELTGVGMTIRQLRESNEAIKLAILQACKRLNKGFPCVQDRRDEPEADRDELEWLGKIVARVEGTVGDLALAKSHAERLAAYVDDLFAQMASNSDMNTLIQSSALNGVSREPLLTTLPCRKSIHDAIARSDAAGRDQCLDQALALFTEYMALPTQLLEKTELLASARHDVQRFRQNLDTPSTSAARTRKGKSPMSFNDRHDDEDGHNQAYDSALGESLSGPSGEVPQTSEGLVQKRKRVTEDDSHRYSHVRRDSDQNRFSPVRQDMEDLDMEQPRSSYDGDEIEDRLSASRGISQELDGYMGPSIMESPRSSAEPEARREEEDEEEVGELMVPVEVNIADLRDPAYRSTLPAFMIEELRADVEKWNAHKNMKAPTWQNASKVTGRARVCLNNKMSKTKTIFKEVSEDQEAHDWSCQQCTKNGCLCVQIRASNVLTIVPLHLEDRMEGATWHEREFWAHTLA